MDEPSQPSDVESAVARAVRIMGGPVATARFLGVERYQAVQSWVRNGIPARYCPKVEAATAVSRKELRPNDWHEYWPDAAEA